MKKFNVRKESVIRGKNIIVIIWNQQASLCHLVYWVKGGGNKLWSSLFLSVHPQWTRTKQRAIGVQVMWL